MLGKPSKSSHLGSCFKRSWEHQQMSGKS
jgi:hypothetical protein